MVDAERRRLAAILGMLGSDSPGERDNAARMAEEFRRQHRMTWDELLRLPPTSPEMVAPQWKAPRRLWLVYAMPYRLTAAYATGAVILLGYGLISR